MEKTRSFSQFLLPTAALLSAFALGCGADRPVEGVTRAQYAVNRAAEKNAVVYSPVELQIAEDKLTEAIRAMDRDDNEYAARLASEALVQAKVAEAKADSENARLVAAQTRADIEALEQRTEIVTAERPSTVVVQRSNAPDLVIEHQPPPKVVIEHQPAPAVIVSP